MKEETMGDISADERHWRHAPRWAAVIAALAIGGFYAVLPNDLRFGPRWLLAALIVVFLIPLNGARYAGNYRLTRIFGFALTSLVTAAITASAILLIVRLPSGKTPATHLLRDGALIWGANILVFAIWYWEVDCGGPHERHMKRYTSTDFLFPQMTLDDERSKTWSPDFLDYLFQSFNTSAAFSPTDVLILSRRVKALMMVQSLISLVVVAVLISRAINALGSQ
jgi:hypothetical protein